MKKVLIPVFVLLLLCSCTQEEGYGTMKIYLHQSLAKTINVGDGAVDVVKYTVSGSGPGGRTFAVDSTSSAVVLDGMTYGIWNINAIGFNSAGKAVVKGEKTFEHNEELSPVTVNLEAAVGSGSLQLKFRWDSSVNVPVLKIKLGEDSLTSQVQEGLTYTTVSVNSVPCGTYRLSVELYNRDVRVSGLCEVVRIFADEKTSAELSFRSDWDYPAELSRLNLVRAAGSQIKGHFEGLYDEVNCGEPLSIKFLLDSNYSESLKNCDIQWFLDGTAVSLAQRLLPGENEITICPSLGFHILNAVVCDSETGEKGSLSKKFQARPSGKKGAAVLNMKTEGSVGMQITPFKGGRFVILSDSKLKVVSVWNNLLMDEAVISASDEGFGWLRGNVTLNSCSSLNLIALTDEDLNVRFFELTDGTLKPFVLNDEEFGYYGKGPFPNLILTDVNFVFCNGIHASACVFDRYLSRLLYCNFKNGNVISQSVMIKPEGMKSLEVASFSKGRTVVSSGNGVINTASYDGKQLTSLWNATETDLEKITHLELLNDDNLLVSDGEAIYRYSYSPKYCVWSYCGKTLCSVKDLVVSETSDNLYVLDKENNLISYGIDDFLLIKTATVSFDENVEKITLSGNDILVLSETGSVYACRIVEK